MSGVIGHRGLLLAGSGPSWDSTVIDLPFNGANGSTVFTDASGRVWTGNGNAQLSTAQFMEGTSSLTLDGAGDFLTTPDDANLRATGDLRFTCWIRPRTISAQKAILAKRIAGTSNFEYVLQTTAAGRLNLVVADVAGASVVNITSTGNLALNTWQKLAFQKIGTSWGLEINDTSQGSAVQSGTPNTVGVLLHIGRDPTNTARDFDGYIDRAQFLRP